MHTSEHRLQRHTCPQGMTAIVETPSWQITQVLLLLSLDVDAVVVVVDVSLSRVIRDCASGGMDWIVSWNDRFRLRSFSSVSLISFASSIKRFSSAASRDEIRVAAFSWAAAAASIASLSSRSARSASLRIRSLSSRSAVSR